MPVRFTQPARLDLHERAGDGRRDGKLALRYQAIGAARIGVRALGEQAVAMGERPAIERAGPWIGGKRRRHRSLGDIDLALGEIRGTPKYFASTSGGVWPTQSVMLNVPNSEK